MSLNVEPLYCNSQVFGEAFQQFSDTVLTIKKQACTLPQWIIILIKCQVSPYAVSSSFPEQLFLDLELNYRQSRAVLARGVLGKENSCKGPEKLKKK